MPLIVAVAGCKGAGKSSFSRLLVNSLLNDVPCVMYMDTDCGQPEYGAPGMLSLHALSEPALGPPHTHPRPPIAAHFVGDVSPQSDPDRYAAAVAALYEHYATVGRDPHTGAWAPLVVNTHGWVKSLGLELLARVLATLAPSHVVQLLLAQDKKNLPLEPFWCQDPATCHTHVLGIPSCNPHAGAEHHHQQGGGASTSGGGGAAAGPPGGARVPRALKPVEGRALLWHGWAKQCLGLDPAW